MNNLREDNKIIDFLNRVIIGVPAKLTDILFAFNFNDKWLTLKAKEFLGTPDKYISDIFNQALYTEGFIETGKKNYFIVKIQIFNLALCNNGGMDFAVDSEIGVISTLLNASGDNTNFVFEVTGPIDDERMSHFNGLFKETKRKGKTCYDIATSDRMQYLHDIGCNLKFVDTAKALAKINLIKSGGKEMPDIIAGMLKKFYFENQSGPTSLESCIEYLADNDVADYGFDDLKSTYRGKVANFLLCTFTGMRLGSPWNGRQDVNGGYIVVKNNGDVVAFHSTIADEFKDFLVAKMIMESPSHSRHKDMVIYKEGNRYFLKLGLQLRFSLSR